MTIEELDDYVWERLPRVRRAMAGRAAVSRIVRLAVSEWQAGAVSVGSLSGAVERKYGTGIFLSIILSALISEVVKIIIRWWLERRENGEYMVRMVAGLHK
jgi:spore maturation protein SpmA